MQEIYEYTAEYTCDECTEIEVPALEGRPQTGSLDTFICEDDVLDIMHFSFGTEFEPYDSEVFTTLSVRKTGGTGETARGDEYYEQLTREEADFIVKYVLEQTLGIKDAAVTTNSDDFIEENEDFDEEDEDYEDDEEE